jgi:hypothetical protein
VLRQSKKKEWGKENKIHGCIAFRLGADETLTLSARSLVIGREGVGLKFRTSPGNENTFFFHIDIVYMAIIFVCSIITLMYSGQLLTKGYNTIRKTSTLKLHICSRQGQLSRREQQSSPHLIIYSSSEGNN